MALTVRQSRRLRISGIIISAGIVLALFYTLFSDGLRNGLFPYINAVIIGFLLALLISFFELYVFTGGFRRLKFITSMLIRTVAYLALIPLIIFLELAIARMVRDNRNFCEVWASEEFQNYLLKQDFVEVIVYTLAIAFTVNFILQMSRKMGQGVLWSFITGRYYKPVQKEFIFMFVRIKHSDQIVKRLGRLKFHKFLNDFIFDITETILEHQGHIHQYIEDEMVVYWNIENGLNNANCIRTFFDANKSIHELKEKYYLKYELVPQIQAAYHCGQVVQGEIGAVKSEIAFYGDVMNTSSRILAQCTALDKELLLSAHLIYRMELPAIYESIVCGKIELKGKEKPLELFSVREINIRQK